MLKNYLHVAVRNFRKNKLYAGLNILALAIGFAAFILMLIYLHYETHFENFHRKADRIYRPTFHTQTDNGYQMHWARVPINFINELPNDIPEIETLVRFQNHERKYIRIGEEKFRPEHAYVTDPEVFAVFDFKLLAGNSQTALQRPYAVVITASLAQKYFGEQDAMGRDIYIVGDWTAEETRYTVTGVMKDLPSHTHLPVDMLISFKDETERSGWAYVYTLLQEGAHIKEVEAKMPAFISKYTDENETAKITFEFQPLTDIHLHSELAREIVPNGNGLYVKIFFFVGLFILLIALINFINLSSAISLGRFKEVGVRTILGAGKSQLMLYSLTESLLYNLLAITLSGCLAYVAFPFFKQLTAVDFLINFWALASAMFLLSILCGIFSGLYPAIVLTSFNTLQIIKHSKNFSFAKKRGFFNVKRTMVTLQFCISVMLMGSAFVAYEQFRYLHEKNLGMTKEQIISIANVPDQVRDGYKIFRDRLKALTGVQSVAACMEVPSREIRDAGPVLVQGANESPEQAPIMDIQIIDADFIEMMGIRLLAGEDSSQHFSFDPVPAFTQDYTLQDYLMRKTRTYFINETAMKQLGWQTAQQAIGQNISWSIDNLQLAMGPIAGVVQDFHQETLKNKVDPLVMVFEPIWLRTFLIKLETQHMEQTIAKVQAVWNELFPAYPMEYHFLDELYENLYKNERIQLKLLYIFSALAIFIAFMGLFGLIAYSLRTRTKEIAIRKVMGADLVALIRMISKEYLVILVIGGLIAIPVSYFSISQWLQQFAYRIEISALGFLLTLGMISLLLLLTISLQTWRSASLNPADTLRDE